MNKKPLIILKNVSKIYKMGEVHVKALDNVSLEIYEKDFVAIIGSSGSGKSTMMNLIGCLDTPTSGKIFLKDKDINKLKESQLAQLRGKTIGFIFQQYNLIGNLTVFGNVKLPLEFQEISDSIANKRVEEVLKIVSLEDKKNSFPKQLSGGQQQRVSIARGLASNPDVILADEPTGALDSVTGNVILNTLHELWKKGKTIIMITHDLNLAKYAKTIVELKDGKIIKIYENKKTKIKITN